GISLYVTDRAVDLAATLYDASDNNYDPSSAVMYADDLTRGYALDVQRYLGNWDSQNGSWGNWHSLVRRRGTYTFPDSNPAIADISNFDDEGWVQLGLTEAQDGTKDLYLHESVIRWDGWSLAARRFGN